MKIKDVNHALNIFEEASKIQVEASKNGDYKIGNKNYDKIIKVIKYLKESDSLYRLKPYLLSEELAERLWSACWLLRIDESNSIQTLEKIALDSGIIAGIAKTTLSEWRKGNITWL